MKNILIIAAHPDDETYGVGGTIVNHVKNGDNVEVLILTDGVTARHNEIEKQKQAALNACKILGVKEVYFAGLPDQKLDSLPLLEIIIPINDLIKKNKPEIVYTHHGGDVNQDHRTVFDATMVAVRPVGTYPVKKVLCYEVPSSTEWAPPLEHWIFRPNVYVDINKVLDIKLKAINAYTETYISEVPEFPHPRSKEAVRIYAQQRGVTVGINAAETFFLIRDIN